MTETQTSCSSFVLLNNDTAADCDIYSRRVKGFVFFDVTLNHRSGKLIDSYSVC